MEDKKTLITIIVLLALFLPAAIVGTYRSMNQNDDELVDDNPNHELFYNNKMYFYYNDELLNTYDCSDCSVTETVIDDTSFHTNYFSEGTKEFPTVLNSAVAMFHQGDLDYIYSITAGRTLSYYNSVKDYNVEHTSPVLIVKSSNQWGVIDVSTENVTPIIEYRYQYIALPGHLIDGKLDTSQYIALVNNRWYILDSKGQTMYSAIASEVVDFNDSYYVTFDSTYHIYDFNNVEFLADVSKERVYAAGDYILVLQDNNTMAVYDICDRPALQTITLPDYETMYFNQTDAGVEIILDGNLYQTIEET